MNDHNKEQQLRYLEEVCIPLHRAGFETQPLDESQLPVHWNGAPLCRITGKGSVFYRREDVDLDLFDFAPDAHTLEEYGKYMIRQSGHFDYDENLDDFYDYEKYGFQRMNEEDGMFTDRGYIAYKGYSSLRVIMNGDQSSHMKMGDMT